MAALEKILRDCENVLGSLSISEEYFSKNASMASDSLRRFFFFIIGEDIVERGLLKVANHVGRHSVETRNLVNLELPRFEELRLLRRDGDLLVINPFL